MLFRFFDTTGVKDSKKMTSNQRANVYERLHRDAYVGVGRVNASEIDEIGMGRSRRLVFHRALDSLLEAHPSLSLQKIIVDGTLFESYRNVVHECIPGADCKFSHVAAASIVAKHTRDTDLLSLCDEHPELASQYGWRKNKGYPTSAHRIAVSEFGFTQFHRRTFNVRPPA